VVVSDHLRRLARRPWVRRVILVPLRSLISWGIVVSGPGRGLRLHLRGANIGYLVGGAEPDVQALVAALGPDDVFYDIGANIGYYSLLAARNGARVIAFEPHPVTSALLRRNAAANGLAVELLEIAAGEGEGEVLLSSPPGDHGAARISAEGIPVRVARIDALDLPAPTFVKIDVEGFERQVISGLAGVLRAHRPVVISEIHGSTLAACSQQLESLDYVTELHDDGGMPHLLARPAAEGSLAGATPGTAAPLRQSR
jgi:FkbM family methyltransferase